MEDSLTHCRLLNRLTGCLASWRSRSVHRCLTPDPDSPRCAESVLELFNRNKLLNFQVKESFWNLSSPIHDNVELCFTKCVLHGVNLVDVECCENNRFHARAMKFAKRVQKGTCRGQGSCNNEDQSWRGNLRLLPWVRRWFWSTGEQTMGESSEELVYQEVIKNQFAKIRHRQIPMKG